MMPSRIACGLAFLAIAATADAEGRRAELDHVGAYNFMVEISGVSAGYFKGVDGLNAEIEVVEFQDGDDLFLRKRPGRAKYANVTLKRGYVSNGYLEHWWKTKRDDRRTVTLSLIQYPTKKGKRVENAPERKLCAYTLHDAKLQRVQTKKDGDKTEAIVAVLPRRVSHTCQSIMLEPGEEPKPRRN